MATLEENLETLIAAIGTDHKVQQQAIGVIANLQTAATNLVSAINEVKATADAAVAGTAPNATTTVKGIAELATDSEALAMSAQDVVLTPGNIGAIRNVANGLRARPSAVESLRPSASASPARCRPGAGGRRPEHQLHLGG